MRTRLRLSMVTGSMMLLGVSGHAWADDAAKPADPPKPTLPSIGDILTASGITASGYIDATYAYINDASTSTTSSASYNTFTLQQAALTVAYQPTSGFGGLVNVIAGQNPYLGVGAGEYGSLATGPGSAATSRLDLYLLQAFAQYVAGPVTLQAGKFTSLAGEEGVALPGNSNTTRSILWGFEPVTHTGVRMTYAANSTTNLFLGVNNGWNNSQELSLSGNKTLEFGVGLTPSKTLSASVQGYYGGDALYWGGKANQLLLDGIITWTATSKVTLAGTVDYGNVGSTSVTPSASWYGVAGYANVALNDQWRLSLRGEYFDDTDGYLTSTYGYSKGAIFKYDQKLKEVTVTFGYDPSKNFELRLEGRTDQPGGGLPKQYQAWVEALYKFPGT